MTVIKVVANPYVALDKDGVPQGAVGFPGMRGVWIGAAIDLVACQKTGKTRFYFPEGEVKVTLDATICNAVLDGSLLAADEESAHLCGIREKYQPPAKQLELEKAKAAEYVLAAYGGKVTVQDIPRAATSSPEDAEERAALDKKAAARRPAVNLTPFKSDEA